MKRSLAVASLGAMAITGQILLIREFLVIFYGNELCMGLILASWLLGIVLGASLAAPLTDRIRSPRSLYAFFPIAMGVVLPVQILAIRSLRSLLGLPPGEFVPFLSMVLSSLIVTAPFGILVGFAFPTACRAFPAAAGLPSRRIGWTYILEGAGSMAGGLLLTFLWIYWLNPFETALLMSGVAVLTCAAALEKRDRAARRASGLFFLFLLFFQIAGGTERLNRSSVLGRWRSFNPHMGLVRSVDSPYENIALGFHEGQYNLYGNGHYMEAFPNDYETAPTAHLILTEHPAPKRVLLIGGGLGGLLKALLLHSVERVDYVELDPYLIRTVLPYLDPGDRRALDDPRVRVRFSDGRYFLRTTAERYDVIAVNTPDPTTAMINRFYTEEFYRLAKARLREGGVLFASVSSAVNYLGEDVASFTGSFYETLKRVFRFVVITPGTTAHFFASDAPGTVTTDTEALSNRYLARKIETPYFSPYHYDLLLPKEHVAFMEKTLGGWKGLELNTDFHPVSYFFSLLLWDRFSGSRASDLFRRLMGLRLSTILMGLLALALARILYVKVLRRGAEREMRFNALFSIATTGFASLSLELVLVFAFQNLFGYMYGKIGLIVALFMVGLALGGLHANRLLRGAKKVLSLLAFFEGVLLLFALGVPVLFPVAASLPPWAGEGFFFLLVGITGYLTGIEFPLANHLFLETRRALGHTASRMERADHLGACAGALFTGVVFVPILGLRESCLLVAALKGIALAFLLCRLSRK